MAGSQTFRMPDVGEGLTEAEILSWRVNPGDVVAINDILLEVETAKAAVELPSPFAGIVAKLHQPEGATVSVGEPIITITQDATQADPHRESHELGSRGTTTVSSHAYTAEGSSTAQRTTREPVLVGYGPTAAQPLRRRRRNQPAAGPDQTRLDARPQAAGQAKPPVRKLARVLGVDVSKVNGTGPGGQVIREDVQKAAADVEPLAHRSQAREDIRIPIRGVRKRTAEAMVASAFTAPHVTIWLSADVTRTIKLLDRIRADRKFADLSLSPMILIMRAALLAIGRNPQINAAWDAANGNIVQHADVNLGIAAATPRGLIVPNIPAAQNMPFRELAEALTTLIKTARSGQTRPGEMTGGTFTITNIGVFGVDGGTPILNPGEAAILCVGQIRKQPWAHKGKVRLRDVTTLALSFDHRLVDGELGSRVLADIAGLLERPDEALAS